MSKKLCAEVTQIGLAPNRCIILPHIGSATLETRLGMATLAAKNALAGVFGEALPASVEFR